MPTKIVRTKQPGQAWETTVEPTGGGGGDDLATVLANGNDAGAQQITNLADGIDSEDAATVGQVGEAFSSTTLGDILSNSNDGDAQQIKNIDDATDPQDAVTLAQLQTPAAAEFKITDGLGVQRGLLFYDSDSDGVSLKFFDSDGVTVKATVALRQTSVQIEAVESFDFDLNGPSAAGHCTLSSRGVSTGVAGGTTMELHGDPVGAAGTNFNFIYGEADPTVDTGIEAPPGTLYSRTYDPGGGTIAEAWFKTGVTNTDWTNLTP